MFFLTKWKTNFFIWVYIYIYIYIYIKVEEMIMFLVTPLNTWTRSIPHERTRSNPITNISHSPMNNWIYLIHNISNLHKNFLLWWTDLKRTVKGASIYKPNTGHIGDINLIINYSLKCTNISQAFLFTHDWI
jgi:hypothetical protein